MIKNWLDKLKTKLNEVFYLEKVIELKYHPFFLFLFWFFVLVQITLFGSIFYEIISIIILILEITLRELFFLLEMAFIDLEIAILKLFNGNLDFLSAKILLVAGSLLIYFIRHFFYKNKN